MSCTRGAALLVLLAFCASCAGAGRGRGCGGFDPPAPSPAPPPARGPITHDFDDLVVDMARTVPGYAGSYVDPGGAVVIALVDPAFAAAARAEIARVFAIDASNARIRTVRYDFVHLAWWKMQLRGAFGLPGVQLLAIDPARNKLVVAVDGSGNVGAVRTFAGCAGVPADALEVVRSGAPTR